MCNIQNLTVAIEMSGDLLNYATSPNGGTTLGGVEGIFLQLLLDFLGINTRLLLLAELSEFIGHIDAVKSGLADMTLGKLIFNDNAFDKGTMSMPYKMEYITFAVRKSVPLSTRYAFLHTYTLNTWLGFLVVFVFIPFISVFILGNKLSYMDAFFQMFSTFLRQGMKFPMVSLKNKILILFFLHFTMVVSFGFSAVFFTFMVNPLKNPPIRNFKELSDAQILGTHESYTQNSSSLKFFLGQSRFDHVRALLKAIEEDHFLDDEDIYEQILAQGSAVIEGSEYLDLKFGKNQEIFISEDKINLMFLSICFRKDFCLKDRINTFIARASRAGLGDKIINDYKMKKFIKSEKTFSSNIPKPLTLYDISGVFIILIVGYIISVIVLVLELVLNKVMCISHNRSN